MLLVPFLVFRAGMVALSIAAYLSLPRSIGLQATAMWRAIIWFLILVVYSFVALGYTSGPEVPFICSAYVIPAIPIAFLFNLRRRMLVNAAACLLIVLGYYGPHPEFWAYHYNGMILIFLFFAASGATLLGHMVYRLEHAAFSHRREIEQYAARLEEMNSAKDDFVSTISHELRTPLTAIIGLSDVVLDERLPLEAKNYVRIIHDSGEVLLRLINDVLDLSKIRAGAVQLEAEPVSLYDVVETSVTVFTVPCQEKGIELTYYVPWGMPAILGDPGRLNQILLNLIGNAVKFTSSGEIQVIVTWEPAAIGGPRVIIAIADTGPGIPEDRREAVFEEFAQVDPSTARRFGGTGLGLPIVRRLARLMGRRDRGYQRAVHGSVFTVTLPAREAAVLKDDRLMLGAALPAKGAALAVCAANSISRKRLVEALNNLGVRASPVDTLGEAAEVVAMLPDMKGVLVDLPAISPERLSRSKLITGGGFPVPIAVIVGAKIAPQDVAAYRRAGARLVLQRPVLRLDLRNAVARMLESANPPVSDSSAFAALPPGPKRRLLVVDDVQENRLLVKSLLKSLEAEIDLSADGAEAIGRIKTSEYDLVLLDLEMPGVDGYAVLDSIRDWERRQGRPSVPVIALTAHPPAENERRTGEDGFGAHLQKPLRRHELIRTVEEMLRRVVTQRSEVQTNPEMQNLRGSYLTRRREELDLVDKWLSDKNYEEIRRMAHNMKGSGGSYGLFDLSLLGQKLEDAARRGDDGGIRALVTEMQAAVAKHARV